MPEIVALFGPTGVGKTDVAIALADELRGRGEHPVAVSADALQVYTGLEVLTGAAGGAERARLEHRLISFLPVDATFSAGQYAELAHAEIDGLLASGQRPIVVGGTGLYLRAALTELSLRPPPPEGVRERWTAELQERGPAALHATLAARAPWAAAEIDPGDRQRIVRALELLDAGELEPHEGESELWTDAVRRPALLIGLILERDQLYARIDARVDGDDRRRRGARSAGGACRRRIDDRPQGARIRRAAGGGYRRHETPHAQLRAPSADVDAKAPRGHGDRHHRPHSRSGRKRDHP